MAEGKLSIALGVLLILSALGRYVIAYAQAHGTILVIDYAAGTDGKGALFSVAANTGERILLGDFGNAMQGPTGQNPVGVALGANNNLLVIDHDAGTGGKGALFSVAFNTGERILLSDFGNATQGPTGVYPFGVALGEGRNILVIDQSAGMFRPGYPYGSGVLFSVVPNTGARTLLSDLGASLELRGF